jgi:hypothetical protein
VLAKASSIKSKANGNGNEQPKVKPKSDNKDEIKPNGSGYEEENYGMYPCTADMIVLC